MSTITTKDGTQRAMAEIMGTTSFEQSGGSPNLASTQRLEAAFDEAKSISCRRRILLLSQHST